MEYKTSEILGKGAYGLVKKGLTSDGSPIAVKICSIDGSIPYFIIREINFMKVFNHPNLIGLLNVSTKQETIEICMTYGGDNLHTYIFSTASKIRLEAAPKIFTQIFTALEYLHYMGAVHRDIKPENILIKNGLVKLCDFGISKKLHPYRKTANTYSIGTLNYKPPELFAEVAQDYGTKIDIWACGCLAYEYFYRKVLFEGTREITVLRNIMQTVPSDDIALEVLGLSEVKFSGTTNKYKWSQEKMTAFELSILTNTLILNPNARKSAHFMLGLPGLKEHYDKETQSAIYVTHNEMRFGENFYMRQKNRLRKQARAEFLDEIISELHDSDYQTKLVAINIFDKYVESLPTASSMTSVSGTPKICASLAAKYCDRHLGLKADSQDEKRILEALEFEIHSATILDIYKTLGRQDNIDRIWDIISNWLYEFIPLQGKSASKIKDMLIISL